MTGRRHAAAVLAALALAACSPTAREPAGVETTATQGPVTVTVSARPAEVEVGRRVTLTIDVAAEAAVVVEMPQVGETLGDFAVRDARTPPDVPDGDVRRQRHTYELDTFAPGQVEIPSLTVAFTDARSDGDPVEGEATTEALAITVRSVLAEGDEAADFRDIRDAVAVPGAATPAARRLMLALGALALVAAAAIAAWVLRGKRVEAAAPPVPAHVRALLDLEELEAGRLPARALFHEYYVRLSGIVRVYIERRFGLMAPERTTDEFLAEAQRSPQLSLEHKALLEHFLRAADMVKFARYDPSVGEADDAMAAARGFVTETAPAAPAVEAAA